MDIEHEINQHIEWIETLVSILGNREITKKDLQEIRQDDRCALGHWLNSEDSSRYKDLPELGMLKESHEAFHRLAGDLVSAVESNKEPEAIAAEKQFIAMSRSVIGYLQLLQKKDKLARE